MSQWEPKVKDLNKHADTMSSIVTMLRHYSPEEAVMILSGVLGKTVCKCSPVGSRHSAVMWTGVAMDATLDMVRREIGA